MRKNGFTLAEVLVTLGIIGVVAALTTPALIQNVGNAKVGPKLQKAVATFETAAEMMLTEQNANSILSVASDGATLGRELSSYMKIAPNGTNVDYTLYSSNASHDISGVSSRFDSEDGLIYWIGTNLSKHPVNTDLYSDIPANQYIGFVRVDINGTQSPNKQSKDLFLFALYNDGTLRPWGGHNYMRTSDGSIQNREWDVSHACDATAVNNPNSCTGSIFDNGMKIIYQ